MNESGNLRFLENFVFNCAGGATDPLPYPLLLERTMIPFTLSFAWYRNTTQWY